MRHTNGLSLDRCNPYLRTSYTRNNHSPARTKRHYDLVSQILLKHWDPIGVGDTQEASHEYDGEAAKVYDLLSQHEPRHEIIDLLWWTETERLGLSGNILRIEQVVDRLLVVREEMDGAH